MGKPGQRVQLWSALFLAAVIAIVGLWLTRRPEPALPELGPLLEGNAQFAFDAFARLRNVRSNVVFSPYSVSSVLAILDAGARGPTAQEIEKAARFPQGTTNLHKLFGSLGTYLDRAQKKGGVQLISANSVWVQEGCSWQQPFLDIIRTDYRATVKASDFAHSPQAGCAAINQWVEENTRHKIPGIVGPAEVDTLTRLVVVNAVYFKGTWANQFPEWATRSGEFIINSNRTVSVPMMSLSGEFSYFSDTNLQCVTLPYKKGRFDMVILLPRAGGRRSYGEAQPRSSNEPWGIAALEQMEEHLDEAILGRWLRAASKTHIPVTIPKFKVSTAYHFNQMLEDVGINEAFDIKRADFSGMSGTAPLFVTHVLHRAVIEVNEKGTEAAAATGGEDTASSNEPEAFVADHPFIFLVREVRTGAILFMGQLVDPTSEPM